MTETVWDVLLATLTVRVYGATGGATGDYTVSDVKNIPDAFYKRFTTLSPISSKDKGFTFCCWVKFNKLGTNFKDVDFTSSDFRDQTWRFGQHLTAYQRIFDISLLPQDKKLVNIETKNKSETDMDGAGSGAKEGNIYLSQENDTNRLRLSWRNFYEDADGPDYDASSVSFYPKLKRNHWYHICITITSNTDGDATQVIRLYSYIFMMKMETMQNYTKTKWVSTSVRKPRFLSQKRTGLIQTAACAPTTASNQDPLFWEIVGHMDLLADHIGMKQHLMEKCLISRVE